MNLSNIIIESDSQIATNSNTGKLKAASQITNLIRDILTLTNVDMNIQFPYCNKIAISWQIKMSKRSRLVLLKLLYFVSSRIYVFIACLKIIRIVILKLVQFVHTYIITFRIECAYLMIVWLPRVLTAKM